MALKSTLFAEDALHHFPVVEFIVHSSQQNCLTFMIEVRANYFRVITDTQGKDPKKKLVCNLDS